MNKTQISYIITHRSSDPTRARNLRVVVDYLTQNTCGIEIIVVEQDTKPSEISLLPHTKYIFAYNNGAFNRSWGLNIGFKHAATHDIIAFGDNDLIIPCRSIIQSYQTCPSCATVSPYPVGSVIALTSEATETFIKNKQVVKVPGVKRPDTYAGGIIFMMREAINKVGGWDERIRGWGGEDDQMATKIEKLIGSFHEIKSSFALHLYHPPDSIYTTRRYNSTHEKNKKIIRETKMMSPLQLQHMCVQQWPHAGNPCLYSG